jgi:transcriptional regulator with XRE-family HTH domain
MDQPNEAVARELGAVLQELRKAIGLKQEEVAAEIHASRSFITQLETGRMELPADRFSEIVRAFLRHIGDIGVVKVDPSLVLALRRLKVAVTGTEEAEDEQVQQNIFLAFYETTRALTWLAEMLTKREKPSPAAILAPLIGLLLLFPDVETSLLVQLITAAPTTKKGREQGYDTLANYYMLFALFLANQLFQTLADRADVITKLIQEELASDENRAKKLALLRDIRGQYADDSGIASLLDEILSGTK